VKKAIYIIAIIWAAFLTIGAIGGAIEIIINL
jgi:hypothetical protein